MFAKNMGRADRIIRAIVAALLIVAYVTTPGGWTWILLALAAVLLVTAALGSCPPYKLLGISTRAED